jgi:hypothetical protein
MFLAQRVCKEYTIAMLAIMLACAVMNSMINDKQNFTPAVAQLVMKLASA